MPRVIIKLTNSELRSVMKSHLGTLGDMGDSIDDSTTHENVLSPIDGFGAANSKAVYKSAIRLALSRARHDDPDWPRDWMSMTVADLADFFIPK